LGIFRLLFGAADPNASSTVADRRPFQGGADANQPGVDPVDKPGVAVLHPVGVDHEHEARCWSKNVSIYTVIKLSRNA